MNLLPKKIMCNMNSCAFILTFCSILPFVLCASDVCTKVDSDKACSCVFPNGTGIDITPFANSTFLTTKVFKDNDANTGIDLVEYFYHPCMDLKPTFNATVMTSCQEPLSLCRHNQEMTKNKADAGNVTYTLISDSCEFLGNNKYAEFSPDGSFITYINGPSKTTVNLVCVESDDQLHVVSLEEPNDIKLSFYSRSACLKQIRSSGRSLGSTLCIIFFSLVIFYLVLGMCTKKFLMGATGVEIIPNLAFWSDLPNLVRDGWAFMLAGFKLPSRGAGPAASPPNPNSYDSI